MADVLLTPIEEMDNIIKGVVDHLKVELISSDEQTTEEGRQLTSDKQIERIRNLIFTGKELTQIEETALPVYVKDLLSAGLRLPIWDAGLLTDADWVKRYNAAIEDGDQELAMRILVDKEGVPSTVSTVGSTGARNKYCELSIDSPSDVFNDVDRIKALLWYLNYVFFNIQENVYAAYHMIRERKKQNTIFPFTSPWYFTPTLKGAWEKQETNDRYVDYFNQELYIPFKVDYEDSRQVGCNLKVNNNLINGYVLVGVTGNVGDLKVSIATETLREDYEHINTPADLALRMNGVSSIGSIELTSYSDGQLIAADVQSYTKKTLRFTIEQVDIFIMAYYGDYTQKPKWVALNIAPERRIVLEGWTDAFNAWLDIHKPVKDVFLDLLFLNPLDIIVDYPYLEDTILPETLQAKQSLRTDTISEDMTQRLVDILHEDDVILPSFIDVMDSIELYVDNAIGKKSKTLSAKSTADVIAKNRSDTLFGRKEGQNIIVFKLPPFWSLQKVSVNKFNTADYWRDIADLNNIGNPLDEVEMFEGRDIILPKSASDKV